MFDLRHLEHSTIIYEDPQHHPLLRLGWNKQDPNYLATMAMDAMEVGTFHLFLKTLKSIQEHSTIIYEDPQHHPLHRLGWTKRSQLSCYHGNGRYGGLYISLIPKNTKVNTRALQNHLGGPPHHPHPQTGLEQTISKLSRYHGDGRYGVLYISLISS